MAEERTPIPEATWNRVFEQDKDGRAILEELYLEFADADPFVAGDPYATHVNLGKAEVVKHIMRKTGS